MHWYSRPFDGALLPAAGTMCVSFLASLVLCAACVTSESPDPGVLWIGDGESGDLSQFEDTPWNTVGGGLPPQIISDRDFVRDGRYAVRTAILSVGRPGSGICCGSRSELVPRLPKIQPGDDLYFALSTFLDEDFPTRSSWQTFAQWHDDAAGSPPLELSIEDGRYWLSGGSGHPDGKMPFREPLGPAVPGKWVDWVVHVVFSPDPEEGYLEIWKDDAVVLPRFQPGSGTMYPTSGSPTSYLKVGYYRDERISAPGRIYYDSMRVGTTRAAVSRPGTG